MPNTSPNSILKFRANVPGASSLALCSICKEGQSYHDAIAELGAAPSLVFGWQMNRENLPAGSIAYHPLFGDIVYGYSWWYASTMELMDNLKAAEANEAIAAHVIHIDSCGGDAFGLHEAFELIRSLKKPCYAVVESIAASAAYYIAAGCDKIYTTSKFSKVGSIGTMFLLIDNEKQLEQKGIRFQYIYSSFSTLKNEDFRKLEAGETKEFIEKYLDPLAKAFIEDVKTARKKVEDGSDALKGELYLAEEGQAIGLADGVKSFDDTVIKLAEKTAPAPAPTSPSRDINSLF